MASTPSEAAGKEGQQRPAARKPRDLEHAVRALRASISKLLPHRARRECQLCCERRLTKSYNLEKWIPDECAAHMRDTCNECIRAWLSAQLDCKPLLEIGCPACALAWDVLYVRLLLGKRDKKKLDALDILTRERALVPEQLPDLASLDQMLEGGTRFCPWCRFPFVKEGGCDSMTCSKCYNSFSIWYALVLEDGTGRRAADVRDEWSVDYV